MADSPVMSDPRWLTASEARAWRALQNLSAPLAAALNRQLTRDSALSSADYEVLVVLSESPAGVLRAGELGRATGWEKSRLSHHIKRMVARGLVERRGCVTDGRGLMVAITPNGQSAIEQAAPGHVEAVREYVIDLLTPGQLEVLAEVGEAVGARLAAENCAMAALTGGDTDCLVAVDSPGSAQSSPMSPSSPSTHHRDPDCSESPAE
jgi:DNA-binding MarR family transcriptional regulator